MVYSTRALALSTVGLAAIVVGTIGIAHARQPVVADTPPAVYGLDPATAPSDQIVELTSSQKQHVTVRFNNAPIQRVLDWLGKQDANFVVSSSSISSDLKISLNVKDEPLSSVENAIAAAMGGSWAKRDGIMVFRKSGSMPFEVRQRGQSLRRNGHEGYARRLQGLHEPGWQGTEGAQGHEGHEGLDRRLQSLHRPRRQRRSNSNSRDSTKTPSDLSSRRRCRISLGPNSRRKCKISLDPNSRKKMQWISLDPNSRRKCKISLDPKFQKKMQRIQFGPEFQKKMQKAGLQGRRHIDAE